MDYWKDTELGLASAENLDRLLGALEKTMERYLVDARERTMDYCLHDLMVV